MTMYMDFIIHHTTPINPISTQLVEERLLPHIILSMEKEFLPLLIGQTLWQYPTYFEVYQINILWVA